MRPFKFVAPSLRWSSTAASLYRFAEAPSSAPTPLEHWWGHAFGFVGAADRHLAKYTDVLAAAGVSSTSRATVPTLDAFFLSHRLGAHAEAFLDVANERFGGGALHKSARFGVNDFADKIVGSGVANIEFQSFIERN